MNDYDVGMNAMPEDRARGLIAGIALQSLDDLSKTLIETGELTQEQCIYYFVALANQYRDAKRKAVSATS